MGSVTEKLALQLAYAYILVPFIIFCFGWLTPVLAVLFISIILISYFLLVVNPSFTPVKIEFKKKDVIYALIILFVLVFFSGIGCYAYQNEDHQFRNAVLNDLILKEWPFVLNKNHQLSPSYGATVYTYYILYWLPAALVGKMFGLAAGYFFLFFWTLLGMGLIFYFFSRYFKKISIKLLLIFILFDGLYIYGSLIKVPLHDVFAKDYTTWVRGLSIAGSSVDSLYWIYNQIVTSWLICLLILNKPSEKNVLFLYALSYFHGPFFFIGFFPYVVVLLYRRLMETPNISFFKRILPFITFQNIIGGLTVVLLGYFFMSASPSTESLYFVHVKLRQLLPFIFLTSGVIFVLIFDKYKHEPLYYITIALMFFLPSIGMGTIQPFTFCARVSLAPLFMLMILVARYINEEPRFMKRFVVAYCVIGSLSSLLSIGRSVVYTTAYWTNREKANKMLYDNTNPYTFRLNIFPTYRADQNFLIQNDLKTLDTSFFVNGVKVVEKQDHSKFYIKHMMKNKE